MQINSNINFKANHISTVQIKKLQSATGNFDKCRANFVELFTNKDLKALEWINKHWKTRFATDIYIEARNKLPKDEYYPNSANDASRFFALTLQNDSFETLSPNNILGITQLSEGIWDNVYHLDYLQTKPAHKYLTSQRKYKNIGTEIINQIKKIYTDKEIVLMPEDSATNFYLKNGFRFIDTKATNMMFWGKRHKF